MNYQVLLSKQRTVCFAVVVSMVKSLIYVLEMSIPTTGNESEQHQKAKIRLKQIVTDLGIIADYEIKTGYTQTDIGERTYTVDLFGFWTTRKGTEKIAFEVRGYKGHDSKWSNYKDRCRDKAHLAKGIKTVRIEMKDLVGRKKMDDETIKEEILWQLDRIVKFPDEVLPL